MNYMSILNSIQMLINNNMEIALLAVFILLSLIVIAKRGGKKKLKKTNYKKVEKGFFNAGFKTSTSFYDILKFKLRLDDFDDKQGVNYIYLFDIKAFNFEICRMKYKNQEGRIFKRKIKFGSII